ncbi:MAG: hypothetical protein KGK08_09670 [Acidobacteriota bacterium]|nr:hypothetical protein [Acidobacteriota bacterium]
MLRLLWRPLRGLLLALALAALLAYAGDWAVWQLRCSHGQGMGQLQVSHITVAALKGNKQEFYDDGVTTEPCSHSLFPHAAPSACWWLERHTTQFAAP